jgi:hypothetical protein
MQLANQFTCISQVGYAFLVNLVRGRLPAQLFKKLQSQTGTHWQQLQTELKPTETKLY